MTEIKTSVIEDAHMKRIDGSDGKVYIILDHVKVMVIEPEEPLSQLTDDEPLDDEQIARFVVDGEDDLWVEMDNGKWTFCGYHRPIRNMTELEYAVSEQTVTCYRDTWQTIADKYEGIKSHGYIHRDDFSVILEEYDGEPDSSW